MALRVYYRHSTLSLSHARTHTRAHTHTPESLEARRAVGYRRIGSDGTTLIAEEGRGGEKRGTAISTQSRMRGGVRSPDVRP